MNINVNAAFENARAAAFDREEKTYLNTSDYTVRIEVTGSGFFPFDNLRRYRLVPTDAGNNMDTNVGGIKTVALEFADNAPNEHFVHQCADRFASFGWSVSECDIVITRRKGE